MQCGESAQVVRCTLSLLLLLLYYYTRCVQASWTVTRARGKRTVFLRTVMYRTGARPYTVYLLFIMEAYVCTCRTHDHITTTTVTQKTVGKYYARYKHEPAYSFGGGLVIQSFIYNNKYLIILWANARTRHFLVFFFFSNQLSSDQSRFFV